MAGVRRTTLSLLLFLGGLSLITVFLFRSRLTASPSPIAPTPALASNTAIATPSVAPLPSSTPQATASPVSPALPPPTRALTDSAALPLAYLDRFGVTGSETTAASAHAAGLPFGSYASWSVQPNPYEPQGVTFWQMIRLSEESVHTPWGQIEAALSVNPGSIWLIGNEPDVPLQDNVTPARYAELYHDLYTMIKEQDPTALVAIGGVSQPTLLRRAYLDQVLESYQERYGHPLPVDIWNVHAFILREEQDSWGVDIPPGMNDGLAMKYEIADHNNMSIFRQNIIEFRAWMADRGYRDRPLLVSEYGFLMPHEYGFPPEEIASFMHSTFDFFLTARNDTGYPSDDNRLVQWWFWFYLGDSAGEYSSSYLLDQETGQLTALGEAFAEYVTTHAPSKEP